MQSPGWRVLIYKPPGEKTQSKWGSHEGQVGNMSNGRWPQVASEFRTCVEPDPGHNGDPKNDAICNACGKNQERRADFHHMVSR